jgi:hypothetical protein
MSPDPLTEFARPPHEFSLMPFWFWNDDLNEAELLRQMTDFESKGVFGFVIHPRVGLPRHIGWLSERMLQLMRLVVEEAARRDMKVILYDEGMYPSGSSSGQVVAENPVFKVRGLERISCEAGEEPSLSEGQNLVALCTDGRGQKMAVIDRPINAVVRGLHYIGDGPEEDEPPAADLLNPEAVACFISKVYETYFQRLGDHFGKTIIGIFTDEPMLMGRSKERGVQPGTTGILGHVERILGYDFTPHLPALWDDAEPDAERLRADYEHALNRRLEETYYATLSQWCQDHGTQLMGHPAEPTDLGLERYFHVPGQDLVWRWVLPNHPTALEGPESTQAKCSSSAMIHLGRRRNSNECFGAYGHELTYQETRWLVDWCFVRGVNMLMPHAFYYSVRGPRWDERPPDVGPNSAWWDGYEKFAGYCQRMCWLNSDSQHICHTAILGEATHLPWSAAKACFQNQRDFNYLEMRDLWETAAVDGEGIRLQGMDYRVLIIDGALHFPDEAMGALSTLSDAGRLILWQPTPDQTKKWPSASIALSEQELVAAIDRLAAPELTLLCQHPDLRVRHIRKHGADFHLFFNEGAESLAFSLLYLLPNQKFWLHAANGTKEAATGFSQLSLEAGETKLLFIPPKL